MPQKLRFTSVAVLPFLLLLLLTVKGDAQNAGETRISKLIGNNLSSLHMSSFDQANTRISSTYTDKLSGATMVYLQQTYKGIDVYNAIKTLAFKNDRLVSASGLMIPKMEARNNNPEGLAIIRPWDAVLAAAEHLHLAVSAAYLQPPAFKAGDKQADFGSLGISGENIKVHLLWMPVDNGRQVKLTWQVDIAPYKTPDHWLVRVDAADGKIINKDNLTVSCNFSPVHKGAAGSNAVPQVDNNADGPAVFKDPAAINSAKYRVVPFPVEAPSFAGGTPILQVSPWLLATAGNLATTLKWNDDGNSSFATTKGNNVYAKEDHYGNNGNGVPAVSITPLPDLLFDYALNDTSSTADSVNTGAATTNLFYWNNIMHDIAYQYGFDEAAGNFQANNLGRGGAEGDYVLADAQDGSGTDNADFDTPPDGENPRMQMYLFNGASDRVFHVNAPAADSGFKHVLEGNIGVRGQLRYTGPITAGVVTGKDILKSNYACATIDAAKMPGNVALIEKGGKCSFATKIKNAQNAGAVAVIIVNDVPGGGVTEMTGADTSITIPAVMISKEDGAALRTQIGLGLNVTLRTRQFIDGDLDAGVICHEYTHGISNRLTGGPAATTCLTNEEQMGEGWSDYNALMVTTDWTKAQLTDGTKKRPIGTYVIGQLPAGGGIRTYPYSTDMTVDPWTYDQLAIQTFGEPHNIGEIWTSVIWDMTWAIIQQDGVINKNIFDATAAGGNTAALKLVFEGMKLQPCNPGFIDGRDAILKADTILYNGKYSCTIRKAFARRGMGANATEGNTNDYADQAADYTLPRAAPIAARADKDSAAQNELVTYTIGLACRCADVTNFKVVDTLPGNITYVSGGTYNSADRTVSFSGINLAESASTELQLKGKIKNGSYFAPGTLLEDSVNSNDESGTWQQQSYSGDFWRASTTRSHTGPYSYFAGDGYDATDEKLITRDSYPLSGASQLSFWHYYDVEAGFDGGVVEMSIDDGETWIDLGPYMTQHGYNGFLPDGLYKNLAKRWVFTGSSNGVFVNTVADLSSFEGQSAMFRFSFETDEEYGVDGWYIDDITLRSYPAVVNRIQLFDSGDTLQSASIAITTIEPAVLAAAWGSFTAEKQGSSVLLGWKTLQQVNTASFSVERSNNGAAFAEIGSVQAAVNNTAGSYSFTDAAPLPGTSYYRINEIDKEGRNNYSPTRSVSFDALKGLISISPNPAKDRLNVTIAGNAKPLTITLFTAKGQKVQVYKMAGATALLHLPPALAAGVYYVRIEGIDGSWKVLVR